MLSFLIDFDVFEVYLHFVTVVFLGIYSEFKVVSVFSIVFCCENIFSINVNLDNTCVWVVLNVQMEPFVISILKHWGLVRLIPLENSIINSEHKCCCCVSWSTENLKEIDTCCLWRNLHVSLKLVLSSSIIILNSHFSSGMSGTPFLERFVVLHHPEVVHSIFVSVSFAYVLIVRFMESVVKVNRSPSICQILDSAFRIT